MRCKFCDALTKGSTVCHECAVVELCDPEGVAASYVRAAIEKETYETRVSDGDQVEVDGMQVFDCVPMSIVMDHGPVGRWALESCRGKCFGTKLSATYRFSGKA